MKSKVLRTTSGETLQKQHATTALTTPDIMQILQLKQY